MGIEYSALIRTIKQFDILMRAILDFVKVIGRGISHDGIPAVYDK
jgi:hypothetical protein